MGAPCSYKIGTPYARKGHHWAAGYHTGVDFLCPSGTVLKASAPGRVIHAGWGGWGQAYGCHVIVEILSGTLKGKRYLNAHLQSVSVKAGQLVVFGQALGKSGATGNVTGPHDHFEVRVKPYGYWQHVNPAAVIAYLPKVTIKYPHKPALGTAWIKLYSQNAAFNNDHGIKTGDKRFPGLVAVCTDTTPDLICFQELPKGPRNKMDKALKPHGYVRMAGNYGRYTYGRTKTVKKVKAKSITPATRASGAVKPYTMLVCRVDGVMVANFNMHLMNGAGYAGHRRKYLREVIPMCIADAKRAGLPKHRMVFAGDFNGHLEIVEEFAKFGFWPTFAMAHKTINEEFKTTNQVKTASGWKATVATGKPIDMVFTTASRPVGIHNNKRHGKADHGTQRVNIHFAKK